MKKIAILPTLLTLANAVCGFASIACASKIGLEPAAESDKYFAYSGWFIIGAMVFDALDGYVARLSKTASDFGVKGARPTHPELLDWLAAELLRTGSTKHVHRLIVGLVAPDHLDQFHPLGRVKEMHPGEPLGMNP